MKKIIAVLLTVAMLASALVMVGANASPVEDYATAKPGDLLYTVNFNGDSAFSPAQLVTAETANFDDNFKVTTSGDGSAMTVVGNGGTDKTLNFWGAPIEGLVANETTHYTMIYKAASNSASDVKNNSVGIGGLLKDNQGGVISFYNNYANHDVAAAADSRTAISYSNGKIYAAPNDYVYFQNIAAYDVDEDGFVTMMNDFVGDTFVTYILKDGATADLNYDNWIKLQSAPLDINGVDDKMCFAIYCYYQVINTTIKDVQYYKGIYADILANYPVEIEEEVEVDYAYALYEAGYGVDATEKVATAPTIDGKISEGEYTASITPYSGTSGMWDSWFVGGLGGAQTLSYSAAQDEDYVYIAVAFNNGSARDRGLSISVAATKTGEITPATEQKQIGRMTFVGAYGGVGSVIDVNGTTHSADFADYCAGYAHTPDYGHTSGETTSVSEWKISKDVLAAQFDLETVESVNISIYLANYAHTPAAGLASKIGLTGGATQYGMPIYLETEPTAPEAPKVTTLGEASVRISNVQKGLRFKTEINKQFLADLQAVEGNVVEVGTLIAKTDVLGGAALNHDFDGVKLDVKANIDMPFAEGEEYNTYAGSITKIKEKNLNADFTAVGYVKVTNGESVQYFYSTDVANRSAAYVALNAYLDAESYTADQLDVIESLILPVIKAEA